MQLRQSVIVHRSASDKLACLACLGLSLIPVKERERVSGKVSTESKICELAPGTLQVFIYTQLYAPYNFICA